MDWLKLNKMWQSLTSAYYHFTPEYRDKLEKDHNINSGSDYANYILGVGDLLDFFAGITNVI